MKKQDGSTVTHDSTDFSANKRPCYKSKTFYFTVYFMIRYILLFTSLFLSMIAVVYGISNLLAVEATNFFCNIYNAQQVWEHNNEIGENNPLSDSCWKIDELSLDESKVTGLNAGLFDVSVSENQSIGNIIGCLIFQLLALFLLFIVLQNGYYTIYDTIHTIVTSKQQAQSPINPRVQKVQKQWAKISHHRKQKQKKQQRKQKQQQHKNKIQNKKIKSNRWCTNIMLNYCQRCCKCMSTKYDWYNDFYESHFYFDSKFKIFSLLIGEMLEMLLQLYALFMYVGITIFNTKEIVLSQHYDVVEAFAIIVGLNGMITGIAWVIYVVWHNTWYVYLTFVNKFF